MFKLLKQKIERNIDISSQTFATYIMELISDEGVSYSYFKRFIKMKE